MTQRSIPFELEIVRLDLGSLSESGRVWSLVLSGVVSKKGENTHIHVALARMVLM